MYILFRFYNLKNRRIRVGAVNRNTGGFAIEIFSALNHPAFNPLKNNDADISLIRLTQGLALSSTIQTVQIAPQNYYLPDYVPVIYAGWGATSVSK